MTIIWVLIAVFCFAVLVLALVNGNNWNLARGSIIGLIISIFTIWGLQSEDY